MDKNGRSGSNDDAENFYSVDSFINKLLYPFLSKKKGHLLLHSIESVLKWSGNRSVGVSSSEWARMK